MYCLMKYYSCTKSSRSRSQITSLTIKLCILTRLLVLQIIVWDLVFYSAGAYAILENLIQRSYKIKGELQNLNHLHDGWQKLFIMFKKCMVKVSDIGIYRHHEKSNILHFFLRFWKCTRLVPHLLIMYHKWRSCQI